MAKFYKLIFIFALFLNLNCFSQEIRNVKVSQEGTNVLITYDLAGEQAKYQVSLFYTLDDGKTWQGPLKHVTGDVSEQSPGNGKKIYWNAAVEKSNIEGYIQFKLFAVLADSKISEAIAEKPVYSPQYYKFQKGKTPWMIGTMICGAVGTFSHLQANKYYEQYKAATNDASDLHKKVELYDKVAPVAFGIAGFCALEFIIKASKQSKAKKQSLSFYPQPINQGAGIGLAYTF